MKTKHLRSGGSRTQRIYVLALCTQKPSKTEGCVIKTERVHYGGPHEVILIQESCRNRGFQAKTEHLRSGGSRTQGFYVLALYTQKPNKTEGYAVKTEGETPWGTLQK